MFEDVTYNFGSGRYAIYLRKSRKDMDLEARGEGETLQRHMEILKDLAQRMRLNVVRVYAEVVSGESIEARPQMQRLLKDVEADLYDGVLVVEVERLARGDTSDQGRVAKTFKFSGTLIITPAKTYDPNNEYDEEYFEFGLFMSRREYKTIRRRLSAGAEASCREGKYTGNIAPYGYERYKLKKEKGWSLRIVPEQAAVMRIIFDMYANGLNGIPVGYGRIAEELNRIGTPAPSGGAWTAYGTQNILRNPVYAGYIKNGRRRQVKRLENGRTVVSRPINHDCKLYQGWHEAIVSQELWDTVSRRMASRRAGSFTRVRPQQNPLAGLVVCSQCGRIMQRRPYQDGSPASLLCPTKGCPTVSSFLSLVEQRVLDSLEEWLTTYSLPDSDAAPQNAERIAILEGNLSSCRADLQEAREQIERQYDFLERGIYTEEMFFERNALLRRRSAELEERLAELQEELRKETGRDDAIRHLLPKLTTIRDSYSQIADPAARNALLKEVVDHIEYTKSEDGRHGNPALFSIEIYPKIG